VEITRFANDLQEITMKNGELKKRLLSDVMIFDGASGTELYRKNYFVNTSYENLVLSNPDVITSIHESYIEAGAEVITTNTFNASAPKLKHFGLDEKTEIINKTAVSIAKKAAAGKKNTVLIAGSIGPMPLDIPAEEAKHALLQQVNALKDGGADFLIFESMSNHSEFLFLPEILNTLNDIAWMPSFVLDAQAKLADETPFSQIYEKIKSLSVQPDAIGLNCGTGPETTLYALEKIIKEVSLPIVVQPGAGVPKVVDHRFMPMTTPEYFTTYGIRYANLGTRGIGGCCGIASEHIADLTRSLKPLSKAEKSEVLRTEILPENTMGPIPTEQKSPFGKMLKDGKWVKLLEMTPPKGIDLSGTVEKAKLAKLAGFDAINIPDGPRASCRIS